ncbi:MAG: hypothetical protein K9J16_17235 [Melioribacteraceae bacterium]|nr:hypothetical protein [Melioribacteraceae bacterium]MCF8354780.1 hypothetical protein [Melioribacteraceae bacterium]MCF8393326.1 hypothetical protein [Melioribacteraceae bacterium]MCF8419178.1 hypothetical protein [Melioribacteraceae bacterium]
MFEREIKFIYDFSLNKAGKLGNYFTFAQLEQTGVHPAILRYISGELDFLIYEDRQKLLKESVFDYSSVKITEYFHKIGDEVKRTKKLNLEYVAKLMLHAISFNCNYLARPKWALLKFVFEDEGQKSASEIRQILRYIYFFDYLQKIILSYLNKKKVISISYEEFDILLKKVDSLGDDEFQLSTVQNGANSISEFFNIGSLNADRVPVNAFTLFMQEKNLDTQLERIINSNHDEGKSYFLLKDLNKLIRDAFHFQEKPKSDDHKSEKTVEEIEADLFGEQLEFEVPDDESESEDYLNEEIEQIKNEEPEISAGDEKKDEIKENEDLDQSAQDESEIMETEEVNEEETESEKILEESEEEQPEESFRAREDAIKIVDDEVIFEDSNDAVEETAKTGESDIEFAEHSSTLSVDTIEELHDMNFEEFEEDEDEAEEISDDLTKTESVDNSNVEAEPEIKKDEDPGPDEEPEEDIVDFIEVDLMSGELDHPVEFINDEEDDEVEPEEKFNDDETENYKDRMTEAESTEEELTGKEKSIQEELVKEDLETESISDVTEEDQIEDETEESNEDEFHEEDESELELKFEEHEETVDPESEFIDEPEIDMHEDEIDEEVAGYKEDGDKNESFSDNQKPTIDIGELLENKHVDRIVEVVFDHDMEEFANVIEKISEAESKDEAFEIINTVFESYEINPSSKEAEHLKEIISEYFGNT